MLNCVSVLLQCITAKCVPHLGSDFPAHLLRGFLNDSLFRLARNDIKMVTQEHIFK